MKLYITHSKWPSPDHFEALGCEDTYPNMVIRFDFTTENGSATAGLRAGSPVNSNNRGERAWHLHR